MHKCQGNIRKKSTYEDALESGLEPLESIDLSQISTFDDLARAMSKTSFGGRQLGEAVDVLYEMVTDEDCFVVGTFSGAMTPAKMGLLICEMIDRGMINAVVSTGALITHGLVENTGMTHFKYRKDMDDRQLCHCGYNRIHDTLELEKNLDDLELIVNNIFKTFSPESVLSSRIICEKIGEFLLKEEEGRGILKSAYGKKVPVYIPAFTDSELGLDFALFNYFGTGEGKKPLHFNPFLDFEHFTEEITKQKKIGIFTIGGGVPRNWAQQVCPYLDLIKSRGCEGKERPCDFVNLSSEEKEQYNKKYAYAVRICPEPVHWGGLSGCTYSEGISWGKILAPEEGGKYAEVLSDATIAWPVILKAVIERLENK